MPYKQLHHLLHLVLLRFNHRTYSYLWLQEESDAQYKAKGKSSKATASTSTALDAPQPDDAAKPAAPQAEVADKDIEMKDADGDNGTAASSSNRKHMGEMTGEILTAIDLPASPLYFI